MAYPPNWIEDFVRKLSHSLFPQTAHSPLGCHYHLEEDCWEVTIFPSLTNHLDQESGDWMTQPAAFTFDIQQAMPLFEEIFHIDWITVPMNEENEIGPHLQFEGIVNGETILIRLCSDIPKRFQSDPDLNVHVH